MVFGGCINEGEGLVRLVISLMKRVELVSDWRGGGRQWSRFCGGRDG